MNWIKPSFEGERGEFERVANVFGIEAAALSSSFQTGRVEEMGDDAWSNLENTDSWNTLSLAQVHQTAEQVGRNVSVLLEAQCRNAPMEMPIVLELSDGRRHLVSGNTRLMVCRATATRPQIFVLRT